VPGALAIVFTLALLEGCAALMPAPGSAPATTAAGAPAGTPAAAGASAAAGATHAAIDSLPSAEAQRVLDSIPDPIPAGERVPPPAAASADSVHADSAADTASTAVPVPEPTAPLGDKPGSAELAAAAGAVLAADSLAAHGAPAVAGAGATSAGAAGAKSGAGVANSVAGASAPAGPCYRLQVASSTDRQQAESMKRAAESQLELPFAVTKVKTLYKVRTRDCLDGAAVKNLRERARASGFGGAFSVAEGEK
jgi:hypothetical protein